MKSKVKNSLRRFGAAVLAAAIALSGVRIPGVRAAAADDPFWKCQIINDTVTGTGLNQFQYFGDWGTDKNISTLYQNDGHWILVPANDDSQSRYFKMRFMGEKIELYGNKEPILGIFEVFIDGESYGMIDAYHEGTKIYQQTFILNLRFWSRG